MNLGQWLHSIYTGFPAWWASVVEDLRRADVRTYSFGDRMNIAGEGTYPFRVYPLCYTESEDYSLEIEETDYFTDIHYDLN